jgi:hypothetical protein
METSREVPLEGVFRLNFHEQANHPPAIELSSHGGTGGKCSCGFPPLLTRRLPSLKNTTRPLTRRWRGGRDSPRRIAANIAKRPELLRCWTIFPRQSNNRARQAAHPAIGPNQMPCARTDTPDRAVCSPILESHASSLILDTRLRILARHVA